MQRVLLATDGSKASERAASLLAHLPHGQPLSLNVVTVTEGAVVYGGFSAGVLSEQAYALEKADAEKDYQKVAEMFDGANATVKHIMKEGRVGPAIIEAANQCGADLIVVGATGVSQISRVLLGSVSDEVATHARCSVLVVRETGLDHAERPIRICLAYDGGDAAQAALEEIADIPWKTGSDFHVLTIAPHLDNFFGELRPDSDTAVRCQQNLKRATDQLIDIAPTVTPHSFASEHEGEAIVKFAEENGIDLLVIGETPRNTLSRFLLGSTTRYVLRHAPCSVWITRNRMKNE
ncbi:universal stress protein [Novipirellula aureliae]|nr:universal stress protein [Novipirellula aureliae]